MYQCRCRALTLNGEPFYFMARDVPVLLWTDIFTLTAIGRAPLLRYSTFNRAMDHCDLAAGDKVEIDGVPYTVTYLKGFYYESADKVRIPSDQVTNYKLLEISQSGKPLLQFKYKDYIFQMKEILGYKKGKAILSMTSEEVSPSMLQISAGMSINKRKIFFGDILNGDEVIMFNGQIKGGITDGRAKKSN